MIRDDKGGISREALIYAAFVGLVFCIFYGGASFLSSKLQTSKAFIFSWEKDIPFCPGWSLVYLTVTPLVWLALFIFKQMSELKQMGKAIMIQVIIGAFFFLLWPLPPFDSPLEVSGWAGIPYRFADELNLNFNKFPSLHVALSFTSAYFYGRATGLIYSVIFYIWAILIALSTLMIHEHYVVDVIGGIILSASTIFYLMRQEKAQKQLKVAK